jgi:hypothetical protein
VKFLDLALVLPSDSFNYYEWIFLADRFATATGGDGDASLNFARQNDVGFTPFITQLCESVSDNTMHEAGDDDDGGGGGGVGVAALLDYDGRGIDNDDDADDDGARAARLRLQHCSEPSPDGLMRPIILASSISEFDESGGFPGTIRILMLFLFVHALFFVCATLNLAFIAFLRDFRELACAARVSGRGIDLAFVDYLMCRDFLEN